MNSFLYRIAQVYYFEFTDSISDLKFVFSPGIVTINECFSAATGWQTADRLSNLFRLLIQV